MKEVLKQTERIDNFEVSLKGFGKRQKIMLLYNNVTYELTGLRAPRKGEIFSAELTTYDTRYGTRYIAKILNYEEKKTSIFDYLTYLIGIIQIIGCAYGLIMGVDILLIITSIVFYFAFYLYNGRRMGIGTNIMYFVCLMLNVILLLGIYYIPK